MLQKPLRIRNDRPCARRLTLAGPHHRKNVGHVPSCQIAGTATQNVRPALPPESTFGLETSEHVGGATTAADSRTSDPDEARA